MKNRYDGSIVSLMPSKNSIREFLPDSFYHIYNRGVEKRLIFMDVQDYGVFLSYLKTYLLPKDEQALRNIVSDSEVSWKEKDKVLKLLRLNNFHGEVDLVAYCLMPNHFHLLLHQRDETSIDKFMNSLFTRYPMYFNRKHKRVGVLFQDEYKAVRVTREEQLLHLSRYIHKNPEKILQGGPLQNFPYSSYLEYIGLKQSPWVASHRVLEYFTKNDPHGSYKSFVEGGGVDGTIIGKLLLED